MNSLNKLRQKFVLLINSIISRFRSDGKKFKTTNDLNRTIPKTSKKGKYITYFFRFLLGLIIFAIIVAFGKSVNTDIRSEQMAEDVQEYKELVDSKQSDFDYSPQLELYMDRFIIHYINVPNDSEKLAERNNVLQSFFAKGYEEIDLEGNENVSRELNYSNFYDVQRIDKKDVVRYIVSYKTTKYEEKEVEKEIKKGKKKETVTEIEIEETDSSEKRVMLNVPILEEDSNYSVVSYPYFTDIPENEKPETEFKSISSIEEMESDDYSKDLDDFILNFVEKYSSSSEEDISYIMDNPKTLNGKLEFDSILEQKVFTNEDSFEVYLGVIFKDSETGFKEYQNLRVVIENRDNKYYVSELDNIIN